MGLALGLGLGLTLTRRGGVGVPVPDVAQLFSVTSAPVVVQSKPANMGGFGPYYPSLVDTRTDAFPADWALFYSTDHDDGIGGIWMSVCRGDPIVAANWKTYDQALALGWFDSIASKPASTPLFSGQQTETSTVRKIGSTWVMTFQKKLSATDQRTFRATSPDLLNWTRETTPLLDIPDKAVLDSQYQHTGYFVWDLNPFEAYPYTWFGYSLLTSGQEGSLNAMWGANDPLAGAWTFLGMLKGPRGRIPEAGAVAGGYGLIQADIRSAVKLPGGNVAMLTTTTAVPVEGSELSAQATAEFVVGPDAKTVVSTGKHVQVPTPSTPFDTIAGNPNWIATNGQNGICAFRVADTMHNNQIAIARMSRAAPASLVFPPLAPAIPAVRTEAFYDFAGASLPAGLTEINSGATVSFSGGDAVFNMDAINEASQFYETAGFNPATTPCVDLLVEDFLTTSTDCYRRVLFGFASTPAATTAGMVNALYVYTNENRLFWSYRKAGVAGTGVFFEYSPIGYKAGIGLPGYTAGYAQKMRKKLGLRWFPTLQKAFVLGFGGEEMFSITVPGLTTGVPYYPFVEVKMNAAGVTTEKVGGIRVRR